MTWEEQVYSAVDLKRVLARLSPEERAAVTLHYWGDLTCKGVAEQLGWEDWKAKKRIHEALCAIRDYWGVVLPEKPDDAEDAMARDTWWPFVLESLRRHAEASYGDGRRQEIGLDSHSGNSMNRATFQEKSG